ncbi:MAG TPA: hypothetical protein VIU15_32360 [Streptomyces sp.]
MEESAAETRGAVQVTVPGEIMVNKLSGGRLVPGPLRCPGPGCGQARGLTLFAYGPDTHIECPCGHSWNDPHIDAAGVRQVAHLSPAAGPLLYPAGSIRVPLLAYLDEDRSLAKAPTADPGSGTGRAMAGGSTSSTAVRYPECLRQAHALACLAVTDDGGLYERLYPGAGGSAVDAHMAMVVLALALYETARDINLHKITSMPLPAPASLLHSDRLRAVRPLPQADGSLPVRAADDRRLREAPAADWERLRTAARDILTRTVRRSETTNAASGDPDPWRRQLGDVAGRHFGGLDIAYLPVPVEEVPAPPSADQWTAVFDYLEAVLLQNTPDIAASRQVLAEYGPPAAAVAAAADHLIPGLLDRAFGIHDGLSAPERDKIGAAMGADRGVQASLLIRDALTAWARDSPDEAATEAHALAFLGWLRLMADVPAGDHDQMLLMLGSARHTIARTQ